LRLGTRTNSLFSLRSARFTRRPEARNAVNGDVAKGLEACIDKMEADDNIWVGILTANTEGQKNPVFCAGADLKAIENGTGHTLSTQRGGFGGFVYRQRRKPVIIAVWVFGNRRFETSECGH